MTGGIVGIVLDGIKIDKGPMRSSNLEERWTLMLSKIPFLPFFSKKKMLPWWKERWRSLTIGSVVITTCKAPRTYKTGYKTSTRGHRTPTSPWAKSTGLFFVGNPHVSLSVPQGVMKGRFDEEGSRARFHHDRLGRTRHGTTRSASEEMHKRVIEFFLTQQARGGWRCTSCWSRRDEGIGWWLSEE